MRATAFWGAAAAGWRVGGGGGEMRKRNGCQASSKSPGEGGASKVTKQGLPPGAGGVARPALQEAPQPGAAFVPHSGSQRHGGRLGEVGLSARGNRQGPKAHAKTPRGGSRRRQERRIRARWLEGSTWGLHARSTRTKWWHGALGLPYGAGGPAPTARVLWEQLARRHGPHSAREASSPIRATAPPSEHAPPGRGRLRAPRFTLYKCACARP